jgi:thiamine transporter ThiT
VACGTDEMHWWSFLEKMHVQKPAVDGFRTANVALTATAVAMKTVVLHGLIYFCKYGFVGTGPRVYNFLIRGQAHMKAALIMLSNLVVAVPTGF